jgi:hypothetical protein
MNGYSLYKTMAMRTLPWFMETLYAVLTKEAEHMDLSSWPNRFLFLINSVLLLNFWMESPVWAPICVKTSQTMLLSFGLGFAIWPRKTLARVFGVKEGPSYDISLARFLGSLLLTSFLSVTLMKAGFGPLQVLGYSYAAVSAGLFASIASRKGVYPLKASDFAVADVFGLISLLILRGAVGL